MHDPKTILITGASSGIGEALAHAYAAAGVTLLLFGRDGGRLAAIADDCRARGAQVEVVAEDVRARDAMAAHILALDARYPIDLVIANAGVSTGSLDGDETPAQSLAVFEVNVTGVLNTVHPLIARMVARGRGHISVMSSLAGIRALPSAPAYSASKAAVRYYGDALRGMLHGTGVEVSVICPGWITTPLTERNRFPMPFIMAPARAARIIQQGITQKKRRIAFPKRLYYPLVLLAVLPLFLTDPLFARLRKNG